MMADFRLPRLGEIEAAAEVVCSALSPTTQIPWPLLRERCGAEVWVKHENHLPTGAFKVRGGLVYMDDLRRTQPEVRRVIAATRGNHGQSVAFSARRFGLDATVVVPHRNSVEKNAAIRALGAELIEEGHDFQSAYEHAIALAAERGLHLVPSFDPLLVRGVATYALELLRAVPDLDTVYVPVGLGSGICGMIAARDALALRTEIVGVVAEGAPAYALSFAQRSPVATVAAETFADGLACRVPEPRALEAILRGVDRVVVVSDPEIAQAVRHCFTDTHNVAEGAGAASLAALLKDRDSMRGKRVAIDRVAIVLSGGNIDRELFVSVLGGATPGGTQTHL